MHFTVRAQCRQCGVSAAPAPAGHLLHTELGWAGERLGRGWHNVRQHLDTRQLLPQHCSTALPILVTVEQK